MSHRFYLPIIFSLVFVRSSHAQESRNLRIGMNYGIGKQQSFFFNNKDYAYETQAFKILINYRLKKTRLLSYELQIEPGIYGAKHQLLNLFYIQPNRGPDYLVQRATFTKEQRIYEYVINIGLTLRRHFTKNMSAYFLASIGPMWSDTATERVAKGIAFSDILGLGVSYQVGQVVFEIRPGMRHVSNADLQYPNSGHDSTTMDVGVSFKL